LRDEELCDWGTKLKDLATNDVWCMDGDDPFGSVAIHATISLVMKGSHFNPHEPVEVTIEQVGFFFHVVSFKQLILFVLVSYIGTRVSSYVLCFNSI